MSYGDLYSLISIENRGGTLEIGDVTIPVKIRDVNVLVSADEFETLMTVEALGDIGKNPYAPIKSNSFKTILNSVYGEYMTKNRPSQSKKSSSTIPPQSLFGMTERRP